MPPAEGPGTLLAQSGGMNRREFLASLTVGGATVWATPPRGIFASRFASGLQESMESPDIELAVTAKPTLQQIRAGAATRVWRYEVRRLKGPADAVQPVPDSYLGPTLRVRRGQRVRVHFTNELPEHTIVHWHGLHVPEAADGHPRFVVPTGGHYRYDFEVTNRAGTYWYHPHHHDRTGAQVYNGLAGALLVSDSVEEKLGLPSGDEDLPCVIQDRTFDSENQLAYVGSMPMERMTGFLGAEVLVNGRVQPRLSLATRAYRLRLLNGSNSRIYKLAWSDGTPLTVVGTDGGLLERPLRRQFLTFAPGERVDLVLDLTQRTVGTTLTLKSLPFGGVQMMGMGMGMGMGQGGMRGRGMMGRGVPNGAELTVMTIEVTRRSASAAYRVPDGLSAYDDSWRLDGRESTRTVRVTMRHMEWLLNDRRFDMEGVSDDERVTLGSKQIWEFVNPADGMMRMAHPIHLHGPQFRVLERHVETGLRKDWQALQGGLTDEGWKDTFLMMPGERVKILVHFTRHRGLFLYHCHNLEHEDMGMMRNYRVV